MNSIVRLMFIGLAALVLTAGTPALQRILTAAVSSRVSIGDPDLYVAFTIFDPSVSEINNRRLVISPRPFRGSIDAVRVGPDWLDVPPAPVSSRDITEAQLALVEKSLTSLGLRPSDVHGWLVRAPVGFDVTHSGTRSLIVGEIMVDIGPLSHAERWVSAYEERSAPVFRALETQANVHIAIAYPIYFQPRCDSVAKQAMDSLNERARLESSALERATRSHLRLLEVTQEPDQTVLCPRVHPVTIPGTDGWYPPRPAAADEFIRGIAKYEIDEQLLRGTAETTFDGAVHQREPAANATPFGEPAEPQRVASTSSFTAEEPPSVALLSFLYLNPSRPRIDSGLRQLSSMHVQKDDIFVEEVMGSAIRVWIRFDPITPARANQIDDVMGTSLPTGIALFTQTCAAPEAAVASAFKSDRDMAERRANILGAKLGETRSISVMIDDVGNATCGFGPGTSVARLARSAVILDELHRGEEQITARFPIRVGAVWSLYHP